MPFVSASETWARVPPSRPPAIPPKRTDAPVACPEWIYNNRHLVENLWARLKEGRAVATRYEKTAHSFLGVLCLAATADWLK
jgi:transposase